MPETTFVVGSTVINVAVNYYVEKLSIFVGNNMSALSKLRTVKNLQCRCQEYIVTGKAEPGRWRINGP